MTLVDQEMQASSLATFGDELNLVRPEKLQVPTSTHLTDVGAPNSSGALQAILNHIPLCLDQRGGLFPNSDWHRWR